MKRIRAKFIKNDDVKFLSHLDILRTFGRAIRRSGVPVVYSQGFNPHPSISFALPLSVGVTSEGEYVDIDVDDSMGLRAFVTAINKGLPSGLMIVDAQEIEEKSNIMALIRSARYRVKLYGKNLSDIGEKVALLFSKEDILVEKETKKGSKETDIKPNIHDLKLIENTDTEATIEMVLDAGSQANLKPDTVLKALERYYTLEIEDFDVHRLELRY